MKEYESSATKTFKPTYTGMCITAGNKGAATRDLKHRYDKVSDMLSATLEVNNMIVFFHLQILSGH